MSSDGDVKVRVENVSKIFGSNPRGEALKLLREGVSKEEILERTGHVVGVAKASFSVNEGEMFVVMGLSGSGKSTLIRCLNRLIEPTDGKVFVDQENILEANQKQLRQIRQRKLSMVFQHFGLFPHRTVAENTAYGLKVQGVGEKERRERALETLDMVGLGEWGDHYPRNLSGGMQQRVGLARALATDPEILLMDEPFSALDPLIRRDMHKELLAIQDRLQKTIIFITHDLNEATKIGDRIAIMRGGRIIQLATPQEIILDPVDDYVADFTRDLDPSNVLNAGIIVEEVEPLSLGEDTIDTAFAKLQSTDTTNSILRTAFYVVDENGSPVGVVLEQDLVRARDDGTADLAGVMRTTFPQAMLETPLERVSNLCTRYQLPVAVVDDDGRFRGVADPLNVLASFGRNETDEAGEAATEQGPETKTVQVEA